jgi:hypothetical protein
MCLITRCENRITTIRATGLGGRQEPQAELSSGTGAGGGGRGGECWVSVLCGQTLELDRCPGNKKSVSTQPTMAAIYEKLINRNGGLGGMESRGTSMEIGLEFPSVCVLNGQIFYSAGSPSSCLFVSDGLPGNLHLLTRTLWTSWVSQ